MKHILFAVILCTGMSTAFAATPAAAKPAPVATKKAPVAPKPAAAAPKQSTATSKQAPEAPKQTSAGSFNSLEIEKPAPIVEFDGPRLKRLAGGVEITLRSADADSKPMQLGASEILFEWPKTDATKPSTIELKSKVRVDSPQGVISSNHATLEMAMNRLTFTGGVRGSSDTIQGFDADRIVYDLDSGDSVMTTLRAQGVQMSISSGDGSNYSSMNIDHAGIVKFSGGHVTSMDGGVAITLISTDPKSKPLKLNSSSAAFTWAGDGGQPTGIRLNGSVRVDGPQGDIRSSQAIYDMAKGTLDFTGNVQGTSEQIKSFTTDTLSYVAKTGDSEMTNLLAKDVPFSQGDKTPATNGYTLMDVDKAPHVTMEAGQIKSMTGGVEITLRSKAPDQQPLSLKARELSFSSAENEKSPTRMIMTGDVHIKAPDKIINSDTADVDNAKNIATFTGHVTGTTPELTNFGATNVEYDLKTGDVKLETAHSDEVRQDATTTGK